MTHLKLAEMVYRPIIVVDPEQREVEVERALEIPYSNQNDIPTQDKKEKARIEYTKRGIIFWTNIGQSRPKWVTSYLKTSKDPREPDFPTLEHFLESDQVDSYTISDEIVLCKLSEESYTKIMYAAVLPENKKNKIPYNELKNGVILRRRT